VFMRDWHDRDAYCLRPAHLMGVPIDRPALVQFHDDLQVKLGTTLGKIKETTARGVLKPKLGYAKAPTMPCPHCGGEGMTVGSNPMPCDGCGGNKRVLQTVPPASIIGKPKKGGGEAKLLYMTEGVRLVEAEIDVEVWCCRACHAIGVGPKHRCPKPRKARKGSEAVRERDVAVPVPVADLYRATARQARWFWSLPFNPDAPAQILAYIEQRGYEAPVDKKTQRKTTNKKALENLKKQHADDPLFQLQLDWKAVVKIDSTYAVGTMALLDSDDRVHPEYAPIPSTLRDSARHPNLTNVVADKSGPQSLSAGFRRCVAARDGVPAGVSAEEYAAWESRWTTS